MNSSAPLWALFALLLFCGTQGDPPAAAAAAMSAAGNYDDGQADLESLSALSVEDNVGVKLSAAGGGALGRALTRRGFTLDNRPEDSPRIIIVSDTGFRGHRTHGLDPALSRSLPLLTDPYADHAPGAAGVKVERREADMGMLRCMIGRVYRPCWQQ